MTRRSLVVLTVVAAAVAAFGAAGPATAYRAATSAGAPGRVVVQQVVGSHIDACPNVRVVNGVAYPVDCWMSWLTGAAHLVGRSPLTSGAQRVTVAYRVLHARSSEPFAAVTSGAYPVIIPAGVRAVRLPALNVVPTSGMGAYRVGFAIAWETLGGRLLGTRSFAMMQNGDFTCATRFPCGVLGGSVVLGRTV